MNQEQEKPSPFKLTVVKTSVEGEYLVGSYYKIPETRVVGLPGVIKEMASFEPEVLQATPTYVYLSEDDQQMIDRARNAFLMRDQFWQNKFPSRQLISDYIGKVEDNLGKLHQALNIIEEAVHMVDNI